MPSLNAPIALFLAAATCAALGSIPSVHAFAPTATSGYITTSPTIRNSNIASTTLFMAKKKKLSMKERRKLRSKRQPSIKVDRGVLNDLPPVDAWEKTQPTATADTPPAIELVEGSPDDEAEETAAKASALVESQRKSVNSLTLIRKRVEEAFPMKDAAMSIIERGYFVHDNFLSSDDDEEFGNEILSEMFQECSNMLANGKLERDITRLGDGEFLGKILGGEHYGDCPRITEYVVR